MDADGSEIEPASDFLRELVASDCSPLTIRTYAYDLLSWFRFLWTTHIDWTRVGREQVRDFVLAIRGSRNPQRTRLRADAPPAGSLNRRTGKTYLRAGYSPNTINHALSVVRQFYEFHRERGGGPLVNPVPEPKRGRRRIDAHHNPMEPFSPHRRGSYRQQIPNRSPRGISDDLFEELFGTMTSNRDRALLALYWP